MPLSYNIYPDGIEAWEVVRSGLVSDGVVKDVRAKSIRNGRRDNLMNQIGFIRAAHSDKQKLLTYRICGMRRRKIGRLSMFWWTILGKSRLWRTLKRERSQSGNGPCS